MPHCTKCGATVSEDARFCQNCAQSQPSPSPSPLLYRQQLHPLQHALGSQKTLQRSCATH